MPHGDPLGRRGHLRGILPIQPLAQVQPEIVDQREQQPLRQGLHDRRAGAPLLAEIQDQNIMSVPESRQSVIRQYKITDIQLRQIEDEGTDKDWPPLKEVVQQAG